MAIIGNYKVNYDTATTTVNKSMSFDLLFSIISEWYKKENTVSEEQKKIRWVKSKKKGNHIEVLFSTIPAQMKAMASQNHRHLNLKSYNFFPAGGNHRLW